jgi:amino acid adenylation domain-containing protein
MTSAKAIRATSKQASLPPEVLAWNKTEKDFPLDRPITAFFDEQVRLGPDRPAVHSEAGVLTYRELDRRANRVARRLVEHGVKVDDFVGVCMERSAEMVVALLGIVKAGAAYVPLDPEYPRDRLEFMFADSGIELLLTHHALDGRDLPAPAGLTRLFLDDESLRATGAEDEDAPAQRGGPDTAVYMIYTSGSTGRPKGVPNVHRGLVNRLLWMQDAYQLGPDDRVLQKTPYSFDVSVWEFFWPLITGASIVMARPGGHRDTAYLADAIVAHGVTTMHFVPSMLALFLSAPGLERIDSLRQVMCSGEALPFELTRRFFGRLPRTRLHNLYGPTEASIDVTYWECRPDTDLNVIPIGRPIANIKTYVLDEQLQPVPVGEVGELHLGGVGLARGYWNRPELTAERFIRDPFDADGRLYKTGDLARYLPDGAIEYLGRIDFQIKLRGFRIELGEIEAALMREPTIREAVVTATDDGLEEKQLVAYVVAQGDVRPTSAAIKESLLRTLPDYMVPARYVWLEAMPLSPNGKVDRKALPKGLNERPELAEMYVAPQTPMQRDLCRVWQQLLGIDRVGIRDNFFELGGNSLTILKLSAELEKLTGSPVPAVKLFQYPSVEKLAVFLGGAAPSALVEDAFARVLRGRQLSDRRHTGAVAIIGMVGRFPGAANLEQLWSNLCANVESISRFSMEELAEVEDEIKNDPNYVPARGIIDDADKFDAPFFGIGPLEAKTMDPQQRVFLELAWAALENAGYVPARFPGMVGVYAGVGDNHYYYHNVLCHPEVVNTVGRVITGYGNEKDYIATRVSYHLDLTGPSVSANTGCSTSLLAVDNAIKALFAYECDMALAGGVDIFVPQKSGQIFQAGGPFTKDGHCKPFEADSSGTMFCDGAGIVVLKRLEDAVAAGDHIWAVILGSAKNNDGAQKVSFLAPSVEGQAKVIALAHAQANIQAETIDYVESHGTGTPLGDPIEVEALTRAFGATTDKKQFCMLGSIKGHIGHPTIASGVAGLIKVALALHHGRIPATLHYKKPNPRIDFANSPFRVVSELTPWPRGARPRRGAVSSFGFGGTNVHAVLEEAAPAKAGGPGKEQQLILLSAKTPAALGRLRRSYAVHLASQSGLDLADAAYTLQVGRKHHAYRDFVVCRGREDALAALATAPSSAPAALTSLDPGVVFMFPGQGAQYANMGRDLYRTEPVFRRWVDACCDLFRPHLERDLRQLLYPAAGGEAEANEALRDTYYTQPALFVIEYALARYWQSLGVEPAAVIGHSIGEFAGACLADVFSLEDVVPLVALRGRLIRGLPRGTMLSVRAPAKDIEPKLPANIQLAASNGPGLCVASGPTDAIAAFAQELEAQGINARPVVTSHAFHSAMMDPVVDEFAAAVAKVKVSAPRIRFMSTALANWVSSAEHLGPTYWSKHIRNPVLFSAAISRLLADQGATSVFLELGPRNVLCTLTRLHGTGAVKPRVFNCLDEGGDPDKDLPTLTSTLGRLWANGVSPDWEAYHDGEGRRRVPLPTYPFEKKSYWLEPVARLALPAASACHVPAKPTLSVPAVEPAAAEMPALEPLVARKAAEHEPAGAPVAGVRLGRDAQGRPAWVVERSGAYRQVDARAAESAMPPAHDPFAPPPRRSLAATPAQREIWRAAHSGAACAFNEAFSIRLSGSIDDSALREALRGLAVIHEAVRGRFAAGGEQFVLEPGLEASIDERDLSALSEAERGVAVAAAETAAVTRPFDLEAGPLVRATVLTSSRDERVVILCAHTGVADGWSLDVLLEDFSRLYTTLSGKGAPSRLPVHGFGDYVADRETTEAAERRTASLEHWRKVLSPRPPALAVPYDRPRPPARTFGARSAELALSSEVMAGIKGFARRSGVSFYAVLFSALVEQLQRRSGSGDLVIGVPVAGHPGARMEDCVGHLVAVAPVRTRLTGDEAFADICRRSHAALVGANEHAAVGAGEVLADLGLPVETRAPLVAVSFTYTREYPPGELAFGGCAVRYRQVHRSADLHELNLNVVEAHDGLRFVVHGNADLLSQTWLEGFVRELGEGLARSCVEGEVQGQAQATGGATPRTSIERYLVDVWKTTLGVPEVGVETSFYELGGHSLLAVQVFNEIHQKYKVRLPLAALVEHPTVRTLAGHLRQVAGLPDDVPAPAISEKLAMSTSDGAAAEAHPAHQPPARLPAPAWTTVVALQRKGDNPPFFCVSGLGGNPMNLRAVAQHMGTAQPFYGLQHRGVDGALRPHESIEDMAQEFLADIRRVQPGGPYYLGGYSFGGLPAWEMARLLVEAGEAVAGLVLIDTSNPLVLQWPIRARLAGHWANLLKVGPKYLFVRLSASLQGRRAAAEQLRRYKDAERDLFANRVEAVTEASNNAERRYVPRPLPVSVLLVKSQYSGPAEAGLGYPPHESNGWRGLVEGPLEIRIVQGHHLDMVKEPVAPVTAEVIARGLETFRKLAPLTTARAAGA